ncbi:hypothetical protein AAHE18_19G258500 [Arachis hypogaea]
MKYKDSGESRSSWRFMDDTINITMRRWIVLSKRRQPAMVNELPTRFLHLRTLLLPSFPFCPLPLHSHSITYQLFQDLSSCNIFSFNCLKQNNDILYLDIPSQYKHQSSQDNITKNLETITSAHGFP